MVKNKKKFNENIYQQKKIGCPRCSTVFNKKIMRKLKHPSGAILDICNNCGGMWLDKNEVKMLHNFSTKVKK
ncbi:zf-TFIIB domain-containing protein [Candidatus Woesearchaeota archaeon]|nr:zf-TFIIB domain-containing protein [Candidatus Woesearchaeota archaeon]